MCNWSIDVTDSGLLTGLNYCHICFILSIDLIYPKTVRLSEERRVFSRQLISFTTAIRLCYKTKRGFISIQFFSTCVQFQVTHDLLSYFSTWRQEVKQKRKAKLTERGRRIPKSRREGRRMNCDFSEVSMEASRTIHFKVSWLINFKICHSFMAGIASK